MSYACRAIALAMTFAVLCIAPVAAAGEASALDDPVVTEIVTLAEAGMSEQVILAKARQIGAFPVLSGSDLARLKDVGVSDQVLVFMIDHPRGAAQKPSPTPAAAESGVVAEETHGGVRVVINRGVRITYAEVAIDGEIVEHAGKLWEGKSDPGVMLRRPAVLRGDQIFTAYEAALEPGIHEVSVGFAFSTVASDPNDEWGEYSGESYVTRGIRAIGEPLENQKDGDNPGAECTITEGQICEVTAHLQSRKPTPLGGLPEYGISYDTRIID